MSQVSLPKPDRASSAKAKNPDLHLSNDPEGFLDVKLTAISEWISPILVKETRQALKSRQFVWTFFLLLLATATWSLLGYSMAVGSGEPAGPFLLTGYWVILGVPLGVIIPFAVFRSLASEYENDTIQLVTITTMKPYQIVTGKLGSAVLQMLVFFSVLAPCILFTYLLRGVDLLMIFFGLGVSFFGSVGLSSVGLFLAGIKMSNVFRIGVSVLFILGLLFTYMGFVTMMGEMTNGFGPDGEVLGSILLAMCASFVAVGFLAFTASSSQISFPADNRSTLNRYAMLVVVAVVVSMFSFAFTEFIDRRTIWLVHLIVCQIWVLFGFLMCGENPYMSPRVRRSLPEGFFARSFNSFLVPGPGRGYLFATVNLWGWTLIVVVFVFIAERFFDVTTIGGAPMTGSTQFAAVSSIVVNLVYATFFLSANFLLSNLFHRNRWNLNPALTLLTGVFSVAACTILSFILHFSIVQPYLTDSYSNWQILNWYWSAFHWAEQGTVATHYAATAMLTLLSLGMGIASLVIASRELIRQRVAVPERVLQDDEAMKPSYVPPAESIDTIFSERKQEREHEGNDRGQADQS